MPDRDQWDLRGPVRRAENRAALPTGDRHTVVEFRSDGSLLLRRERNTNASEFSVSYTYAEAGRLIGMESSSSAGEAHQRVYGYDYSGRLARVIARDEDSAERTVETYSYDAENRRTKKHFVRGVKANFLYGAPEGREVHRVYYGAPNAASATTIHDTAGRTKALLFHDAAEGLISRVDFVYDDSGNLIEESQTSVQDMFPHIEQLPEEQRDAVRGVLIGPLARSVHRYDALGRRIETMRFLFGSVGQERETFAYNERGDVIARTSEEDNRTYDFNDAGQLESRCMPQRRSEARFLYEYDAHGNWTSKITEYRNGDDTVFSVSLTETRILTYFDSK